MVIIYDIGYNDEQNKYYLTRRTGKQLEQEDLEGDEFELEFCSRAVTTAMDKDIKAAYRLNIDLPWFHFTPSLADCLCKGFSGNEMPDTKKLRQETGCSLVAAYKLWHTAIFAFEKES